MRPRFWLAQPIISRKLHLALRAAAAVALFWGLAAAAGLWTVRIALARSQERLTFQQGEWRTLESENRRRQQDARGQAASHPDSPPVDSADFVNAMSRLAQGGGATLVSAHLEAAAKGATPPGAQTVTQTAAQPSLSAAAAPPADSAAFECTIAGPFPSVARCLDLLARQPAPLKIVSLEVSALNAVPGTPHPPLQVKLAGAIAEPSTP